MTDESFDPYLNWLGIPPAEQPPDHYRLLGLARFESDPRRIEAASDERMAEIRRYQSGPRMAYTQRLLKEISIARLCLLDIQSKASYDTVLRGRQSLNSIGWEETPPPQRMPQPHASPQPYAGPQPYTGPQPYAGLQPSAASPYPHAAPQPYATAPSYPAQPSTPSYPQPQYPSAYDPRAYDPRAYDAAVVAQQYAASQFNSPPIGAPPPVGPPPIGPPPFAPSPFGPPVDAAPPPIAPPPIAPPPIGDHATDQHTQRLPFVADSAGGRPQEPVERRGARREAAKREAGKRGKSVPSRAGSGKGSSRPTRGLAAPRPDADEAEGVAGEPLDASPSLFRSSWFLPTLVLLGVGGILAMWIVIRSGAVQRDKQAAGLGDQDGLIEESVEDMDAAGAGDKKKSQRGSAGGRQTTRSTIDDPFGAVELIQEGTGELHFTAQTAELTGGGLALETRGDDQVVSGWSTAEQSLVWNFRLAKPDIFRVELVYAAGDESRGAQFALQVDDEEPKANEVAPTGAPDKFRTDILHLTVRRSGKHQLRLAVQDLPMGGLVAVKSIRFVPKGLSDRKK